MKKVVFYIILIVSCLSILAHQVSALTAEQVRQQIEDTNNQIETLDKEIKQYQSQIAQTSEQADSLAKIIKELTLTRSKLVAERTQIQKKITATGLVIETLSDNIKDKESSIAISKKSLSKMIRDLNQNDDVPIIERLLSVDNFSDFSREYNDLLSLNQKIRDNIIDVSLKKEELLTTKTQKEGEKQNLTLLKNDLVQKEQVVAITQKGKDTLLNQTKSQEAAYQKLLAERQQIKDTFEKSLEEYEAQLKFILNPNILPKAGSGVLSFPLDYILVTSPYGPRWGGFHYGIDFRASVGTSVKAMAGGVVEGIGNTDVACQGASFGNWVFIKYNNGLSSTFGHLSLITAKTGQVVKTGDVVGLSGGTKGVFGSGSSTGPHLHVSVYASTGVKVDTVPSKSCNGKIFTQPIAALNAYLDLALYLPKITSAMIKK
jgi:murein DD-endopeptidase MepM/ murein hydrolase activator NlpD